MTPTGTVAALCGTDCPAFFINNHGSGGGAYVPSGDVLGYSFQEHACTYVKDGKTGQSRCTCAASDAPHTLRAGLIDCLGT
jgi:hypothetical protein